jgi:hypothetical protein
MPPRKLDPLDFAFRKQEGKLLIKVPGSVNGQVATV